MKLEYCGSTSFSQELDIVDIGNCCIRASTENWADYYLMIKSVRGTAYCLTFGPIYPDLPTGIDKEFRVEYSQMKFNERAINAKIFKFLNDYKKQICEAEECEVFDAGEDFPDIIAAFKAIE